MYTPNLDKFAREGVVFERAFTAAPQCVPSRTALMTGRSPVAARMGRFSSPLPPEILTVPEVLRTKGYYTGVVARMVHCFRFRVESKIRVTSSTPSTRGSIGRLFGSGTLSANQLCFNLQD